MQASSNAHRIRPPLLHLRPSLRCFCALHLWPQRNLWIRADDAAIAARFYTDRDARSQHTWGRLTTVTTAVGVNAGDEGSVVDQVQGAGGSLTRAGPRTPRRAGAAAFSPRSRRWVTRTRIARFVCCTARPGSAAGISVVQWSLLAHAARTPCRRCPRRRAASPRSSPPSGTQCPAVGYSTVSVGHHDSTWPRDGDQQKQTRTISSSALDFTTNRFRLQWKVDSDRRNVKSLPYFGCISVG